MREHLTLPLEQAKPPLTVASGLGSLALCNPLIEIGHLIGTDLRIETVKSAAELCYSLIQTLRRAFDIRQHLTLRLAQSRDQILDRAAVRHCLSRNITTRASENFRDELRVSISFWLRYTSSGWSSD